MGQEQSNSKTTSPTSTIGVSSSFSFLSKKRNSVKVSQIVVVNPCSIADDAKLIDEDIKRMKEIPRFLPILRGILPTQRNSPDILKKIETKYFFRFFIRIQEHFGICRQFLSIAQTSLSTQIIEANQTINILQKELCRDEKKLYNFINEIRKVESLINNLNELEVERIEVCRIVNIVNEYLLKSSDSLNLFSINAESKISKLEEQFTSIEAKLILLEKKLGCVNLSALTHSKADLKQTLHLQNDILNDKLENEIQFPVEKTVSESALRTRNHPLYAKYFKMLKLGVPAPAVKIKMISDGVNSDLLSQPDKIIEEERQSDVYNLNLNDNDPEEEFSSCSSQTS